MDPNAWARFNASVVTRELPPRISRALGELPEKFRSVVHLVDLNELSYREAAEALEVPVGTVMSRLFRGRRQLAQTLNEPKALDTAALDSAAEPAVAA
jgi:RNA polymerase sigma-70 factor (ECF subfamily)